MTDELLPCPFCGATDVTVGVRLGDEYIVAVCKNCEAFGPSDDASYVLATMAWNRRPIEAALTTEIERLREALSLLRNSYQVHNDWEEYLVNIADWGLGNLKEKPKWKEE